MLDFSDLPKQWLVCRDDPGPGSAGGGQDSFAGWHIRTAPGVPVQRLTDATGAEVGRLIGWAIRDEAFLRESGTLALHPGETPEDLYTTLGGRFVLLWRGADGRIRLREDCAGNLPAIVAPALGAVGATVTLLDQIGRLPDNAGAIALFDFPARRGFLPFGLTPRKGAMRLMPNHVVDLTDFGITRCWPEAGFCTRPALDEAGCAALAAEAGQIVRRHVRAILGQGETVLYLSGGHDSRMVIAAALGLPGDLRAQTLGTKQGLDIHVAAKVADFAGIPLQAIEVPPSPPEAVAAWLHRSGGMSFDFVAHATTTMQAHAPVNPPMAGTGAELGRTTNWKPEDLLPGATLTLETLLARLRIPDQPVVHAAGTAWMAALPPAADVPMRLDLAKIEQVHGCWAGSAIYGHKIAVPTIHPFSSHRLTEIALMLPPAWRLSGGLYRAYMQAMSPELLAIPVNKASGLARLRFWQFELRSMIPANVKRWIKPFR